MATERRVLRVLALLPAMLLLALPPATHANQAWWEPLAFAGQRVDSVAVSAGDVVVSTGGRQFISGDVGATFHPLTARSGASTPAEPGRAAPLWLIRDGVVLTGPANGPLTPDPRAPYLGASARLIAAPAALPGVVVAVGSDSHVWRRNAAGQWATSFILLPAGGLAGTPQVTALAAFAQPLSVAVYMGTDGYGVLLTEDGGDDWIRADPGLPENVLSLATDPAAKALYAATDSGLFVHHLQSFPAPPLYVDASLYLRWLGIGVVALLATLAALFGLRGVLPES
jgi:hypothetical protein